ncbi:MAG: GGDEF domain-containing protein [Acidimicrobiales bacterium]
MEDGVAVPRSGAGHRRGRTSEMRFKAAPGGATVVRALRAVALMYLVVPLFALAAALDHPQVRSWPALWAALGLAGSFSASNVQDFRRLRRSRFATFRPGRAFVQLSAAIAVDALAGAAFGWHRGSFGLLPLLPFLAVALIGNRTMIGRAWLVLVAALATETAVQMPALDALWSTVLFAAVGAVAASMVDEVVRGSIHGVERNRSLAELAAQSGTRQDWPHGLVALGEHLARAMDVRSYAVLVRRGRTAALERVFAWPDADWPTWEAMGTLPQDCLRSMAPVDDGTLCATPAPSGAGAVVVLTPHGSTLGSTVDIGLCGVVAGLLASMYERTRIISGLVDMANTDELTGVANRRKLFEALEQEMRRARRSQLPLTVAMLDLDYFKRYNDTFGHSAGDDLLHRFAFRMARRVRAQDLVARYGGEEFCLILPETDAEGSLGLVDALRSVGAGEDMLGRRVTFSAGLATWDGSETADELLFRADAGLYRAKAAGRDRVAAAPVVPR